MSCKKQKVRSKEWKGHKPGLGAKMHFLHKNVQFSVMFVSFLYKKV